MSESKGCSRESVERYVMHLIELKGYERRKLKDPAEAEEIYLDEQELDPEGMPEGVSGETLFSVWNELIDKYPEKSGLSFAWEQFYSLPEDYRAQVEDYWEYEFSGNDHEDDGWMIPDDFVPENMFRFMDDMMMYGWLRKNRPDGERTEELEARRDEARRQFDELCDEAAYFESNSSAVYLTAVLDAELDNGKRITASYSVAEEEGREWTGRAGTVYYWDPQQIASMEKLSRMLVEVNGEKHWIVSGTVTLTGHSDGDPASYADPAFVLEKYFGKIWRVMFRAVSPEQSETEQVEEMKQLPVFRGYPEKTLQDIAHYFWHEKLERNLRITSKLTAGGVHEIAIRTGEKRFPAEIADPYEKPGQKLEIVKNPSKPESHLAYANDYYFGTEEEMELVRLVHRRDFEVYRQEMEKAAAVPMKDLIRPENFRYEMNYQYTVDHVDYNMPVVIKGNHFNFSTSCESWKYPDEIREMLQRRGGNTYQDSTEMGRFMVVSPFAVGFTAEAVIKDYIRMKKNGKNARIITEHQLWQAFADTERNPLLPEEEYENLVKELTKERKPTVVDHAAIEKRMQEAYDSARAEAEKYLDKDAQIVFMDKKYALSGFGEEKRATGEEIEKRGGIFSKNMAKDVDYLVINMKTPGSSDLKSALQYRSKGAEIIIVGDALLQQAMKDIKPLPKAELEKRKQEKLQREAEQRRLQLEKSLEKMRAKYKR